MVPFVGDSTGDFALNINTLPTMIGVVVLGYTSHIFLPSLEGNMKVRKLRVCQEL
ncbi:unnamed protein product [Nippostrongylus brasiliensis]|uniref:Transporter n=1 Tax=Nippostrongylus brasiliensis TaxID=27835 RepID=A0A0N4XN99_NIPBR|nr:unnamed protein product [Nippostrongylus brasiliensis]